MFFYGKVHLPYLIIVNTFMVYLKVSFCLTSALNFHKVSTES